MLLPRPQEQPVHVQGRRLTGSALLLGLLKTLTAQHQRGLQKRTLPVLHKKVLPRRVLKR